MTKSTSPSLLCGVDIGGTFTDVVLLDLAANVILTEKLLTTPHDPSEAVTHCLRNIAARLSKARRSSVRFVHATTLVTNALIERTGARTALITTKGFGDILDFRRENRYDIFDMEIEFPQALVPPDLRWQLDERLDADGVELSPVDPVDAANIARDISLAGVESIAVVLLHSYLNPDHELQVGRILADRLPGIPVSLSSEIAPQIGEYERTSTTAVNAYVLPLIAAYLHRLSKGVRTVWPGTRMSMMLSNGGIASFDTAEKNPVRLLESGPAAGVLAARFYSERLKECNVLAFDMGGTTAKLCIIQNGQPTMTEMFEAARISRFQRGSGIPVLIPSIDLIEIGAGGGSIATLDSLGLLQVGPRSAGAVPGPACYGFGGADATVTDADLLLGYLDPEYFLGGTMTLDTDAARQAMSHNVAEPLDLPLLRAAWGIHDLVNENMAGAARLHLAAAGLDARSFTLLTTGGAGPVHAVHLAASLGIRHVICPPAPGLASAYGLLVAAPRVDITRSFTSLLSSLDAGELRKLIQELRGRALAMLEDAGGSDSTLECSLYMTYVGQASHIEIKLPSTSDGQLVSMLRKAFDTRYSELFGVPVAGGTHQIVGVRVAVSGQATSLEMPTSVTAGNRHAFRRRLVAVGGDGQPQAVDVYHRSSLMPGPKHFGPAVIQDENSSMLIESGWDYWLDNEGVLHGFHSGGSAA